MSIFTDLRRSLSKREHAKYNKHLKDIEKGRRLSYIKVQQLNRRKAAEEELIDQTQTEIRAIEEAKQAYRKRKLTEKELRHLKPGPLTQVARSVGKLTKGSANIIKAGATQAGSKKLHGLIFAPKGFYAPLGSPQPTKPTETIPKTAESDKDFIFGKRGGIF